MNLVLFQKSKLNFEKILENLKVEFEKNKLTILGVTDLPAELGKVIHFSNNVWWGNLLSADQTIFSLLPQAVVVLKGEQNKIGIPQASLLSQASQNVAIQTLSKEVGTILNNIIMEAGQIEPRKVSKVTLYSTHTCPYCVMEKKWLESEKLSHEVVYVDEDQKAAEEMVQKTGQMGVPVTTVTFDDGDEENIVGFDQSKLAQLLK